MRGDITLNFRTTVDPPLSHGGPPTDGGPTVIPRLSPSYPPIMVSAPTYPTLIPPLLSIPRLKYSAGQWFDEELRAIFKTKLGGKAKAQFEALLWDRKEGSFETLVEAMCAACKGEQRTRRIVALGKLSRLRKTDKQSVADFSIELERLTQKAYLELDEKSLVTTRLTFCTSSW
ncbi:hypothetical protein Y032_0094g2748 [Ancylostoma ceylanicum]|uniref:Uncharacterized protein n=1 Tax=Ancylostoma ceylanicum TaxID=53326 RepID=A0A016TK89_9BILA|nr:hypothetical protein Y032_0094g2748 [Ancylostoma ceylanicum]